MSYLRQVCGSILEEGYSSNWSTYHGARREFDHATISPLRDPARVFFFKKGARRESRVAAVEMTTKIPFAKLWINLKESSRGSRKR